MDIRDVIKVELGGEVTSFRYPHFTQGYQPTYEMPPPSTIYGHICSTFGGYLPAERLNRLQFGYSFKHAGKFIDYKEHLHFDDPIQPFPFDRELLFRPQLTLYLTDMSLRDSFQNPHYMVILGRSQDLMTYMNIEQIQLRREERGYFEHTLLPVWMAPRLARNVTVATMARYIDPSRRPHWQTYALLQDVAIWPPISSEESEAMDEDEVEDLMLEGDEKRIEIWIDPTSPEYPKQPGLKRAVWLHRFTGE